MGDGLSDRWTMSMGEMDHGLHCWQRWIRGGVPPLSTPATNKEATVHVIQHIVLQAYKPNLMKRELVFC